jgi:hypothetical protein
VNGDRRLFSDAIMVWAGPIRLYALYAAVWRLELGAAALALHKVDDVVLVPVLVPAR